MHIYGNRSLRCDCEAMFVFVAFRLHVQTDMQHDAMTPILQSSAEKTQAHRTNPRVSQFLSSMHRYLQGEEDCALAAPLKGKWSRTPYGAIFTHGQHVYLLVIIVFLLW